MKLVIDTYCTITNSSAQVNGAVKFNLSNSENILKYLYQELAIDYPKFYKMDNISKLGLIGVELIKGDCDLSEFKEDEIGIAFQTKNGCLESDNNHQHRVDEKSPSPAIFVYTLSNIVIGEISIRNKWFGESALFIEDKSNLNTVYQFAKLQLTMNKSEACIIGFLDSFKGEHELGFALIRKNGSGIEFNEENLEKIFDN